MMFCSDRSVEWKREKSRDDARHRRQKEASILDQLSQLLPRNKGSKSHHVGRIAIVRVANALCRLRQLLKDESEPPTAASNKRSSGKSKEWLCYTEKMTKDLLADSLLLIVDLKNRIVYISSSALPTIGIEQTEIVGCSLLDFVHPEDVDNLQEVKQKLNANEQRDQLVLRFRCALSPTGRNLSLKSFVYKTFLFELKLRNSNSTNISSSTKEPYLLMFGSEIMRNIFAMNNCQEAVIISRHGPDMKVNSMDKRLLKLIGQTQETIRDRSYYSLMHPEDLKSFISSVRHLHAKGRMATGCYRLLGERGDVWLKSEATLSVEKLQRNVNYKQITCVHYVIGQTTREQNSPAGYGQELSQIETTVNYGPPPTVVVHDTALSHNLRHSLIGLKEYAGNYDASYNGSQAANYLKVPISTIQAHLNAKEEDDFKTLNSTINYQMDRSYATYDQENFSNLSPFVNYEDLVSLNEDKCSVHVALSRYC